MNSRSFSFAMLITIPCLTLTSCKETQMLKQQLADTTTKIRALNDEATAMDAQMIELRKSLPATITSEAMIKEFTNKLAGTVVGIENEISVVKTNIQEAESMLSQAQKDLESLKANAAR